MTNEEAVKILEGLAVPIHAEPAFDMAIEALRNSPTQMSGTSDLISRQAVIDLWEQYKPYIAVKACEYDSELRKLPSIQPDWDEMVVICDNCGHAIHVKGGEQNDKRKSD